MKNQLIWESTTNSSSQLTTNTLTKFVNIGNYKSGKIVFYFNYFNNLDNLWKCQLVWSVTQHGNYPFVDPSGTNTTIYQKTSKKHTIYIRPVTTTTTPVVHIIDIPRMMSQKVALSFTSVSGTTPKLGGFGYFLPD